MQSSKVRVNSKSSDGESNEPKQRTLYCTIACPACGKREKVSDRNDLEAVMEMKFIKCFSSSNPICQSATRSASMEVLRARLNLK